jgi:uncharacterized membrane protein
LRREAFARCCSIPYAVLLHDFCRAAAYINLVEHPARMACGTRTAVTVWAPSYKRATLMQAPLAMVSFVAGVAAWILSGSLMWLAGAILIGAVVPVTLLVIMPTNKQLLEPERDAASTETKALLERWGRLHAIRSTLSVLASFIYLGWLLR